MILRALRWGVTLFFAFLSATSAQTFSGDIELDDRIYEDNIKTVLLFAASDDPQRPARLIGPAILPLDSERPFMLEFDDLRAQYRGFRAKLIHCNADWSPSALSEIEYTYEYNNFPITDFAQSFSTKIPYFHYRFEVPRVKVSGNYVLVVFSERERRPVLTRRLMYVEPRIRIDAQARFSQGIREQLTDQQIDFSIDHKGYPLVAPQTDLKVVIRQNFRWDKSKTGFKPTQVRPFDETLQYQFFNLENSFPGGNEFRYFDSRTLAARGFGIYEIERREEHTRLILALDRPRIQRAYIQMDDLNGQYVVDQRESQNGSTEADYTPVLFTLQIPEIAEADVYVNGGFQLWQLTDQNRMSYDPTLQAYTAELLVKQGVVNYCYTVAPRRANAKTEESAIEGNYGPTENDYDILVYFRPPAGRADQLIGYRTVEWNRRR